jgi:hypothetical protein
MANKPKGTPANDADWIAKTQQQKRRRCCVCREDCIEYLQTLLAEINAAKAFRISVQAIYDRVAEKFPGFSDRVGFHNFRAHLNYHEPLWHRSKLHK